MSFSVEKRVKIFARTAGRCHLCRRELAFNSYAKYGRQGCWEVEHSRPRRHGGTDHLHNLYAACIRCNRSKGATSTHRARRSHGHGFRRAPMSWAKQSAVRERRAGIGALGGGVAGGLLGGAKGAVIGTLLGVFGGHEMELDD